MTYKQWLRTTGAAVASAAMLHIPMAFADAGVADSGVTSPRAADPLVEQYRTDPASEPYLRYDAKIRLLKQRVKYVFVLFQENRSFDHYFGTFPGVEGLFSPKGTKLGFTQKIVDATGKVGTISPFLIPKSVKDRNGKTVPLYPADTDSVDHSHVGMQNDIDFDDANKARNDRYALNNEGLSTDAHGNIVDRKTRKPPAAPPTQAQVQRAQLVVSHIDCDTIPFLWQYATRFTLFDNFHQTIIGPSTPNAIAMIAGQSGETQWALHPDQGSDRTSPDVLRSGGQPVVGDPGPFPGSNLDHSPIKPAYNPNDENPDKPALNQTYASLALSFMGPNAPAITASDQNPAADLLDIRNDIKAVAALNPAQVPWAWYQEGFGHEPTDGISPASHASYIVHHNGPQYFGYIGDNPKELANLHGLGDFFTDMNHKALPSQGGVFYVRGGYHNIQGLAPVDPNPAVQVNFVGDDDHPAYSDAQISEALVAKEINTIANSPYWNDSAIIITYDETDGLYDHGPLDIRELDPQGKPLAGGPRIPAIVISPYARAHAIVSYYSEHSSVIKFINDLYGLFSLANLPDEKRARALGKQEFGQDNLGPADGANNIGDLLPAFDNNRLLGNTPVLPASYATIPEADILALPHYGTDACKKLQITPTDYVDGKPIDPPPADFNPRPFTTPGIPTSGDWTP